jgi:hypothetical protein
MLPIEIEVSALLSFYDESDTSFMEYTITLIIE